MKLLYSFHRNWEVILWLHYMTKPKCTHKHTHTYVCVCIYINQCWILQFLHFLLFFSLTVPRPIKWLARSEQMGFNSQEVAVILSSPLSLFKQWLTYQFSPRANISYNINLISRDNEVLTSRMRRYLLCNCLHIAVYLTTLSISRAV